MSTNKFWLILPASLLLLSVQSTEVLACGVPKPNPPPECGQPTPKPTSAPTRVPGVPVQFSVPQPTPAAPVGPVPAQVVVAPSLPIAQPRTESGSGGSTDAYCHKEPSTGNYELRPTTDIERQLRMGDERPIAGVCDQHLPVVLPPAVTATVGPEPEASPEALQPTPVTVEPTVEPLAQPTPTAFPVTPVIEPDLTFPCVPVQVPVPCE